MANDNDQDDIVGNAVRGAAKGFKDTFTVDNLKNKAKAAFSIKNSDKPSPAGQSYPGLMTTNGTVNRKPAETKKPTPKKATGKTY